MSDHNGLYVGEDGATRCFWGRGDPLYQPYHDDEWGMPVDDDHRLFEKVCLEGFQSGLSWLTILRKRENFRRAFADFDFRKVALFTEADAARLVGDKGIIRHKGKIAATLNNAARAVEMVDEFGSLGAYFWGWEPDAHSRPAVVSWDALRAMSTTDVSKAMAKDLKKRGWKFVGPTTAYAFMQAMGIVNDHIDGCISRDRCEAARASFVRPRQSPIG